MSGQLLSSALRKQKQELVTSVLTASFERALAKSLHSSFNELHTPGGSGQDENLSADSSTVQILSVLQDYSTS